MRSIQVFILLTLPCSRAMPLSQGNWEPRKAKGLAQSWTRSLCAGPQGTEPKCPKYSWDWRRKEDGVVLREHGMGFWPLFVTWCSFCSKSVIVFPLASRVHESGLEFLVLTEASYIIVGKSFNISMLLFLFPSFNISMPSSVLAK